MTKKAVLDHLRAAGAKGGRASTPEQQAARRKNIYWALAKQFPGSVKVMQKLNELAKEVTDEVPR